MKVIVAGLPKTGTKSMNSALDILGYNVYDYLENAIFLGDDYKRIAEGGWEIADFRRMYENVDATMDFPIPMFWEEISQAFPDAKIVLTVRDSEEVWRNSLLKQQRLMERNVFFRLMIILSPTFGKSYRNVCKLGHVYFGTDAMSAFSLKRVHYNESMLKRTYITHNRNVIQNAPRDKLLVFNCSEGWGPLCKFLGVPIPDEPFPHANKDGDALKNVREIPAIRTITREMAITTSLLVATSAVTGVLLRKYGIEKILSPVRRLARRFVG